MIRGSVSAGSSTASPSGEDVRKGRRPASTARVAIPGVDGPAIRQCRLLGGVAPGEDVRKDRRPA
jgi:hypothetical protein